MTRRLFLLFSFLLCATQALATQFLPPDQAFRPSARALDGDTVEVRFDIAAGYYLYRDKFRFNIEPASLSIGVPTLPKGKQKRDETFGQVEVLYKQAAIRIPVERNVSGILPVTLKVTSQGCAEDGICYPPQQQMLRVDLPDPATTPKAPAPGSGDESGRIAQLLQHADFWLVIVSFFGFGLLLSLTPCVLPMLPILSGIIVNAGRQEHGISHARGFVLSLAYVLGMAFTYAAAGVGAALTGTLLSSAFQTPWALGGFALIFIALAFSMFGFYELQLPAFLQTRVSEEALHFRRGSLPALAIMGALSALIVGPCVAAPLAGALLYIGQTGDAVLGGTALFTMALGMGVPLLLVGLSAGTLLPKAGPWMESVKKAFGFILLGTALWLVSPFLPPAVETGAWGLLLLVPALLWKAYRPLPKTGVTGPQRVIKLVGVAMLIAGCLLLTNAFSGGKSVPELLASFNGDRQRGVSKHLAFESVRSVAELDARVRAAGQPVMLDFYADWCITCKEMERKTFSDPRVQQAFAGWTLLRADVTANTADDKALLARFQLFGPPGMIFFDRTGTEITDTRVVGFQNTETFLATLETLKR
ncbi:protein-disulfide reductase DsbD [Propionivibrio dicarboxylicus]|uniref:Thiol:disulfide interchange protein DsbD n=1 Tax=Propionivibrio dicarboxylicus TaxID=83767 RepID=A0A1G7UW40_9RHOO|nr:protein-disulfide reductase DsbD [Propionivibrio dicarboxylicus]SDG51753.1 thiol:disulfide interchange protein DsbD [Propionivibrio dicarboxylicus]